MMKPKIKSIKQIFPFAAILTMALFSCSKDESTTEKEPTGATVYVAGHELNSSSTIAKLWKNGKATTLSDNNKAAYAKAVYVSGTDVYVAGYQLDNATAYVAKVWKNGVATSITNGTQNANADAIYVSGNDVYAGGYELSGIGLTAKYGKTGSLLMFLAAFNLG